MYSFDLIIVSYSSEFIIATETIYLPRKYLFFKKKDHPQIWGSKVQRKLMRTSWKMNELSHIAQSDQKKGFSKESFWLLRRRCIAICAKPLSNILNSREGDPETTSFKPSAQKRTKSWK